MRTIYLITTALFLTLYIGCSLSHDYNLSLNPPPDNVTPEALFPGIVSGDSVSVFPLNKGGLEARYGNEKSISAARLSSTKEAKAFFEQNFLPAFNEQPSHFSGNINRQFYAKAKGGSWHRFGWVNENYAFVLKAADADGLQELVNSFAYIE